MGLQGRAVFQDYLSFPLLYSCAVMDCDLRTWNHPDVGGSAYLPTCQLENAGDVDEGSYMRFATLGSGLEYAGTVRSTSFVYSKSHHADTSAQRHVFYAVSYIQHRWRSL